MWGEGYEWQGRARTDMVCHDIFEFSFPPSPCPLPTALSNLQQGLHVRFLSLSLHLRVHLVWREAIARTAGLDLPSALAEACNQCSFRVNICDLIFEFPEDDDVDVQVQVLVLAVAQTQEGGKSTCKSANDKKQKSRVQEVIRVR